MTHEDAEVRSSERPVKAIVSIVGVLALLAAAGLLSVWIQQSEPIAEREAATRRSAALVETIAVERGTYRPTLRVLGTVQPARDIVLSPRVGGQIVAVEPGFAPGGRVAAGEPLVRIDAADYEQTLIMRTSALAQAQAALAIEEGRQQAARREFDLLGEDIAEANASLVLREPQIASLQAELRAAEAAVAQAELDLARTTVRAPFAAQILERSVELGSEVGPGDDLARLVGTDLYWVIATVPLDTLRWIEWPEQADRAGARASVHHRTAWRADAWREGRVARLIGEVDPDTRLARVIVEVPEPLGAASRDDAPLILGSIVQVEIEARPIADVVQLDRAYLRQNDTAWVMDNDTLRIRTVDVRFSDAEHAYIGDGLEAGDRIVTTSLATVVDGLPIRDASTAAPPDPGSDSVAVTEPVRGTR
ncbi:MAG: efflux RND transporter periplasmic adaptor subunit [Acidobacteriota bacterium]